MEPLDGILSHFRDKMSEHPSYTFWLGDESMLSAGILPMWVGVFELWTVVSERLKASDYKADILRYAKLTMNEVARQVGARRLQCEVQSDWRDAHAMAKLMGLTREGTMRCYSPMGYDMDLYSLIIEDINELTASSG